MRKLTLLPILVLIIAITACAPDPRKEADAYATRSQADQTAADQELARQHRQVMNQYEQAGEGLSHQRKQVITAEFVAAVSTVGRYLIGILLVVAAGCTIYLAVTTTRTTAYTIQGLSEAMVAAAQLRANLIPLNAETGTYPLLREYAGHGKYTLTDPNTGMTLMLDTRNEVDRQLATGAIAIRHTGVATRNTARAPKDVADFVPAAAQPPIIDAKAYDVTEFGDFFRVIQEMKNADL